MSYPYGFQATPTLSDLPYTILQRRQGDVKATLIPIRLNGQPVVISGWTFTFSVTFPSGVQNLVWTVLSPNNGNPITVVDGSGFTVPAFGGSVNMVFNSVAPILVGDQIFITGAGVFLVVSLVGLNAVIKNTGLSGNASSGFIPNGTNVYQSGQVGMTVLIVPPEMTTQAIGSYPMYCKADTPDPFPGPYKTTFLRGSLQILPQNNPNA